MISPLLLSEHAQRVLEFRNKAGQLTPPETVCPPPDVLQFQLQLTWEEVLELVEACGMRAVITVDGRTLHLQPRDAAPEDNADAHADISVTNLSGLLSCGIPDLPLFWLIDQSNLAKFAPGGYKDGNGKWRKPPDWVPPDVAGLLAKLQGADKDVRDTLAALEVPNKT